MRLKSNELMSLGKQLQVSNFDYSVPACFRLTRQHCYLKCGKKLDMVI